LLLLGFVCGELLVVLGVCGGWLFGCVFVAGLGMGFWFGLFGARGVFLGVGGVLGVFGGGFLGVCLCVVGFGGLWCLCFGGFGGGVGCGGGGVWGGVVGVGLVGGLVVVVVVCLVGCCLLGVCGGSVSVVLSLCVLVVLAWLFSGIGVRYRSVLLRF
ncbi:hypothetical protein, partial [Neisseria sp. P0019.S003]|uniref:hypothetical protein n=1 Tax=Neisseria sp. P0019.S003 TaxID=3436799 RepID=UPI003F7EF863